jgi:PAS domain S-box-containing protein
MTAKTKQKNLDARRTGEDEQASQYARSLIEASLDPLVTISPNGKITDVNEATVKVTGVSREDLIGTDFSNYFTEPVKAREGYREVFQKGFVTDYPLTIRHKDGRLTDVLYNASVYKDVLGNVMGVFAAARVM